jgi:hypothetical protein
MRQRERVRISADEGGEQSRRGSLSDTADTSRPPLRTLGGASQLLIKTNRQIPELETALSLRKQRTANCSNRQKSAFLATRHSRLVTRISNRERTMRRASASRASSPLRTTRGICSALSNRELLGLEILQLAENKDRQPVLIANFEPNYFPAFRAYVAAAFRRAGFPSRSSRHPGKSAQLMSRSK